MVESAVIKCIEKKNFQTVVYIKKLKKKHLSVTCECGKEIKTPFYISKYLNILYYKNYIVLFCYF